MAELRGFPVLFSVFLAMIVTAQAFIVVVPSRKVDCFTEHIGESRTAYMAAAVLNGPGMDIGLKVYGPFPSPPDETETRQEFINEMIQSDKGEGEQKGGKGFNFDTEFRTGYYKFCLDNSHSRWKSKTVDITLQHQASPGTQSDEENKQIEASNREIQMSLQKISNSLSKIRGEQRYSRARMIRHMQTVESNRFRATMYTVMELGLFFALGAFQIIYVRKWFSDPKAHRWA